MSETLPLSRVVVDRDGPQTRLLVLLHGYGEPASDLVDRLHLIDPAGQFRVVVPDAPFEWRGQSIWHRALSARAEAEAQLVESLRSLDAMLGEVSGELGLAASDAVVGGFSQGGGLALALLLGADVRHRPAAGFGVCSFPPMVTGFRVDRAAARRPYFLSSAREDSFAPIELSRGCAALLVDLGVDLTYVEAEGPHVMTDEAARRIGAWLDGDRSGHAGALLDDVTGPEEFADLWVVA